jgi:hypothetical protein
MPGRTVTICTGDDASIAAMSCPPNAGFHAEPVGDDIEIDRVTGQAGTQAGGDP